MWSLRMVQVGMAMLLLLQLLVLVRGALVGVAVLPARPGEAAAGCNQQQLTVMVLLLWSVPRGMAQRLKQELLRVEQLLLVAVAVAGLGAVAALQLLQQQQDQHQGRVTRRCLLHGMMQQTMMQQQQQQLVLAGAQQGGGGARAGASQQPQHEQQQQRTAMRGCLLKMKQADTARMPLLLLLLALVALVGAAGRAGPGASLQQQLLLQRVKRRLVLMQLAVMKVKLAWRALGTVLRLRVRVRLQPLLVPSAS